MYARAKNLKKKLKPADRHSENNEAIYLLKGGDSVYVNTPQLNIIGQTVLALIMID